MTSSTLMLGWTHSRNGNGFADMAGMHGKKGPRADTGRLRTKSSTPVMRCKKTAVAAAMIPAKLAPVLRASALKDYLDLPTALARLLETNFRVSTELVSALLAEDAERRRRTE